jgi:hypothetical protein
MNTKSRQIFFWAPRVLGIFFALFLSLFALDVFNEGYGFRETLLALVIHLVPVYIVALILAIAWRWERVGAILFLSMALLYLFLSWGRVHWGAFWGISAPMVLLSILFLFSWIFRQQLRKNSN